jgi:hypothetical protein
LVGSLGLVLVAEIQRLATLPFSTTSSVIGSLPNS